MSEEVIQIQQVVDSSNGGGGESNNKYLWKEEAIATFIDAMKEEYRKGTFTDSGFKPQGWDSIRRERSF